VNPWRTPTLLNSWVDHASAGTTYNQRGYYKDANGIVHLRGLVKNGTVNQPIFNLPAKYRPVKDEVLLCNANDAFGALYVKANGDVVLASGSNTFCSLDGISVRATSV
jgi:hypothetical protein